MTTIAMDITIVTIISIGLRLVGLNISDSNTNIRNTFASAAIFPIFFTFTPFIYYSFS